MPEVSPEMAEKVLSADLRNVIKKVGDGVPLSPGEREMMERYLAASAEMEDLAKARSAALLRRWATGGKLSKLELKEIEVHFASEGASPRPSPRIVSDRYEHPLRIYAGKIWPDKDIETGVRTLKRWIKKGKDAQDLPPFDEIRDLARWYERHFRAASAPASLRRFEEEQPSSPPPPSAQDKEENADSSPLPPMMLGSDVEMDSDVGLQQVKTLVDATFRQMRVALERNNQREYQSLRKEWQSLVGTLRQWEKDMVKIQEGKGEVLRTRVINSELVRIFTTLGQSFFNSLLKTIKDLAPAMPPDEQRALALAQRDLIFLHLKGSRFEKSWKPDQS